MKQKILNATNGGLDIILSYYPQARETLDNRKKKFKIRQENTASASLKEYNGVWYVTDFGDQSKGKNCFDIAMEEENLPFTQVIHLLAQRYNIDFTLKTTINKPTIESRPAKPSDPAFTYTAHKLTEAERKVFGPFVTEEVLKNYNYFTLESYSITTKDNKFMTFIANDNYPIFMHDCGSFKKIYKPLEYDKNWRFFTAGEKPRDYINGLEEVEARFNALKTSVKDEQTKLPEVILCSGERDAMNIAGMGFLPIWLNSETASLSETVMDKLLYMCERVYNLPDIDETGLRAARKLALQHLDIYTIELPSWLRTYRDYRGRARKDLRDFVELRPDVNEFRKYLNTACQCKFWELELGKKSSYKIRITSLLYYLKTNGFYKYKDPISNNTIFIRIDGYRVYKYTPHEVRDFIREDLKLRQVSNSILDTFINSKRTTITLVNDLQPIEISFKKSDTVSRSLFFINTAIRVFNDRIDILDKNAIENSIWNDDVIPHAFTRIEPAFTYTFDIQTGQLTFNVNHTKSPFLRMLINASRMYWRKEFEQANDNDSQYRTQYAFAINSPRLTQAENVEQVQHLVNKLFAIGYQLHCFKTKSKALAIWIMENKLTAESESSGGSGKTIFAKALSNLQLLNIATLDGRNKKLTDNPHLLDRLTTQTDILLIDDAHRYFDFDSFYSMITDGMTINPKGEKSFELEFMQSPMLSITSNFPMPNDDKSTMRRILSVSFSDYYHFDNGDGTYQETRTVRDDIGKDLFGDEYTEEEYNADINFCIDCLQFYLTLIPHNFILQAPIKNIKKRLNIAKMGDLFQEWAEVYFAPESGRLNCMIQKQTAWREFLCDSGASDKQWKIVRFTQAIRAYAENCELIFNPPTIIGYNKERKRIMRKRNGKLQEFIYLQTPETPIYQECFFENNLY